MATETSDTQTTTSLWTFSNLMVLLRMAVGPVFLIVFSVTHGRVDAGTAWDTARIGLLIALILCVVAELSEYLGGPIGRSEGKVTPFVRLFDPFADFLYRLTVLFCLASPHHGSWLPVWLVIVIWYRDLSALIIRMFGLRTGRVITRVAGNGPVRVIKSALILFLLTLAVVYYKPVVDLGTVQTLLNWPLQTWGLYLGLAAGIYSFLAGLRYFQVNRQIFKNLGPRVVQGP